MKKFKEDCVLEINQGSIEARSMRYFFHFLIDILKRSDGS